MVVDNVGAVSPLSPPRGRTDVSSFTEMVSLETGDSGSGRGNGSAAAASGKQKTMSLCDDDDDDDNTDESCLSLSSNN